MNTLKVHDIIAIIKNMKDSMLANKDRLIELDSALGDGDLGITMCRGFEEVYNGIKQTEETDTGKILVNAGMIFAQSAPSTMGTLLASGFMKAGKAVSGKNELSLSGITELIEAFIDGIQKRGKAEPGDKTILDALTPALEELRKAGREGTSLSEGLTAAYKAAVKGSEHTKTMAAKHGRPAYYGNKSIGKIDPGSEVGVLIMKAFAEYCVQK